MSTQGVTIDFLCEAGHYASTVPRAIALTQWGVYAPHDASVRVPDVSAHCGTCREKTSSISFGERMTKFYKIGERVSELRNVVYGTSERLLFSGTFLGTARAIKVEGDTVFVLFALDPARTRGFAVLDNSQVPETHLRFFKLTDGTPVVCARFADCSSDHPNVGPVSRFTTRQPAVLLK